MVHHREPHAEGDDQAQGGGVAQAPPWASPGSEDRGTGRHHDWLDPATNLRRWTDVVGLGDLAMAPVDEVIDLRERLARVWLAVAGGAAPAEEDLGALWRLASSGASGLRWDTDHGHAVLARDDRLLSHVAADGVNHLTDPTAVGRIKACEECRWTFLDTTRNGRRRYCDPADCGNRARQRRHAQRRSG